MLNLICCDGPAVEKPDIDDLIYGSADPIPSER